MHHSIQHNATGKYWQCGLWVHHIKDATKYSEDQALAVLAMRELNGSIVPNNTEWRDLTAQLETPS